MGVEVEWEPLPDGHTVPHRVEAAEAAVAWESGERRARLERRIGQAVYVACMVLVPTLIIVGAVKGG